MRIQKIILNNYRLYEGENVVEFSSDETRNVHLICGQNGFGKTTFLHSLLWCLFGRFVSDVPASGQDTSYSYFSVQKSSLNLNAAKRLDSLMTPELIALVKKQGYTNETENLQKDAVYSVTISFTDLAIPAVPCRTIDVTRQYDAILQKESVDIRIDGNRNELTDEIGPDVFINDFILNKDIAKLFFFDSEEIVELAETGTASERRKLSRAYEEVLGIRKYEELKANLESLRMKYRKKTKDIALRDELEKLLGLKDSLNTESDAISQRIQDLNVQIAQFKVEDASIQSQLSREGSNVKSEELAKLKAYIEKAKANDQNMKSQLKAFVEYAPFAIAGKLFSRAYNVAVEDYTTMSNNNSAFAQNNVLEAIRNEISAMLSSVQLEMEKKEEIRKRISGIVESYRGVKSDRQLQLEMSKEDFNEIEAVYKSLTTTYRMEFEALAEKYKKNKVALEKDIRRLTNMQNKENDEIVRQLRQQKDELEGKIASCETELRSLHEKTGEANIRIATVEKQIKELSKRVSVDDADEKKDILASNLISELDEFLLSLKRTKKVSLERRIKTSLNSLMHKEDFIGNVEVELDSDMMDIQLYTPGGDVIDKDTLSKGEKQLYATSLLKSLVDESGIKFPVFIDSPLQKFDKSHSSKIISEFYPSISEQVVLFPLLHKELTSSELDMLLPYVASSTVITNDTSRSGFKTVEPCRLLNDNIE